MHIMNSFWCVLGVLCIPCLVSDVHSVKIKIIDEPFSLNHVGLNAQNVAPIEKAIVSDVKPKRISGPQHLFNLAGKCFVLQKSSFKYEFCPFHNVTQRELSYRWNSFQGVLGIWREWNIINNTFFSMSMTDGEACIAHGNREVTVFLKCGDNEKVIDVSEPRTCKYNLTFETPLACPLDAFLVYPVLTDLGREQWSEIEERYSNKELTLKGYQKKRTELLLKEGLKHDEADEEPSKQSSHGPKDAVKIESSDDYRMLGRHECILKYGELLKEVEQLKLKLKEMESKAQKSENITKLLVKKEFGDAVVLSEQKYDANHTEDFDKRDNQPMTKATTSKGETRRGEEGIEAINHPRNFKRNGRRGDEGANLNGRIREDSISKNGEKFLNSLETSRKKVRLTEKEQEQKDKEIVQKHAVNHRVH